MAECAYRTGQHVIVVENTRWRERPARVHAATVIKVGRKYVTVHIDSRSETDVLQFEIECNYRQHTHYAPDYCLYSSYEQYNRKLELDYYMQAAAQRFSTLPNETIKKRLGHDLIKTIAIRLGATPWEPPVK